MEARLLGTNALLSGVAAGVAAMIRSDPVLPAFARGAGGGVVAYSGKLVAVRPGPGWGLVGRQLTSVGGSLVGNELAGRKSLEQINLAFGPVRAYIGSEVDGVDWRLDVPALGAIAYGLIKGMDMDPWATLSSGALVFRGGAQAMPGTVFVPDGGRTERYVFAHERVHVLQFDQAFLSLGEPFEYWLGRRFPALDSTLRNLDFNLPVLLATAYLGLSVWEHRDQPWEKEAFYLARTRGQ